MKRTVLHPLDVVVSIKVALLQENPWTIATMANDLGMDNAQVYRALRSSMASALIHGNRVGNRVVYRSSQLALVEFLVHGVRYVFPAVRGGTTRGLPTAYAAPIMATHITAGGDAPPVWPDPESNTRGEALHPLHRCVPGAARGDPALYSVLALVDVLRMGRAREREIATRIMPEVLHGRAV